MAKERKCIFCGKTYQYCPSCKEFQNYPRWMAEFDSKKCYDLYTAIGGLGIGIKTKDDVKVVLDEYNIVDYSEFSIGLQNKLNELFPKEVKTEEPIVEEVISNEEVSSVEEVSESQIEERTYRRKSRNKFSNRANTEE